MNKLLEMLEYCRPEGTDTQREFNERYLAPIMGAPDRHGNYVHIIGDNPTIAFMAHHDTVHNHEGYQDVIVSELGYAIPDPDSNCLGADCTTGVWLITEMMKAGIPGVYCVFAAEEIGCRGSEGLVRDNPEWLKDIQVAMSFDRWGTTSVITHQTSRRTASDEFAKSVADALDMPELVADNGGSYTDSNEFVDIVPECTNISVGYYNQHTKREYQDLEFAQHLRDKLLKADWSKLVIARNPAIMEYDDDWYGGYYSSFRNRWAVSMEEAYLGNELEYEDPMIEVISEHPEAVAKFLRAYGFSYNDVVDEVYLYSDDSELAARYA